MRISKLFLKTEFQSSKPIPGKELQISQIKILFNYQCI
jgi:hypothetical protein